VFGFISGLMIVTGLVVFVRLLHHFPPSINEIPVETA
jgi:hypothetical protein